MEISKSYSPSEEQNCYKFWLEGDFFSPKPSNKGIFSLVIPPPNVTGSLHMGHALDTAVQDVLVRWQRMSGMETLWVPGTDHAGIATQTVVERELAKSGQSRKNMSREEFVGKVWEWKEKYGGIILDQLKRLGASCDWQRERFTMDEGCSKAVREVFVSLYEEGLIYQGNYIVNWCPRCHTAISDIEVEFNQRASLLYYLRYPLKEKTGDREFLVVATTRPETMLGDTAVAVNPEDERFKNLIGKTLVLPLMNREIPIIADHAVETAFGTGAVKVTPAHDPNDYLIGKRHDLEEINIFDPSARLNENAGIYQGLTREDGRKKVLEDMEKLGLIEKTEDYTHSVGSCYRCKTIIEPYISKQWYVKVRPLVEPAIEAVNSGKIKFVPERWAKVYTDWMENLRDWCISRQLVWGHRIPVWYCDDCLAAGKKGVFVSRTDLTKCPDCGGTLRQDEDVLDTWFSSALWPFSTLGWPAEAGRPEKTADLQKFYPTSVLVTGYDIITFWVSKMIMMGLKFMKDVPFRTVYIHGLVRDAAGKKMSKSSGNVIDPIPLINDVGADALRFALISLVTAGGQDLKLTPDKITESRNFANKIWNVSRYVLSVASPSPKIHFDFKAFIIPKKINLADRWIMSRCHQTLAAVNELMRNSSFGEAARLIYEFVWNDFCDWYVEISKIELRKENNAADSILVYLLEMGLRLLHPFMPFITENIWQKIKDHFEFKKPSSIMVDHYPTPSSHWINPAAENDFSQVISLVRGVRHLRNEMNVPPGRKGRALVVCQPDRQKLFAENLDYILELAKLEAVTFSGKLETKPPKSATFVFEDVQIHLLLGDLIDVEKEITRLEKDLSVTEKHLEKIQVKLNNPNFLAKAAPEVVAGQQAEAAAVIARLELMRANLASLR